MMFLSEKLAAAGYAPVFWNMQTDMVMSRLDGHKVQWERNSLPVHDCEGVCCVRIEDLRRLPELCVRIDVPRRLPERYSVVDDAGLGNG
mgnify:FL=1